MARQVEKRITCAITCTVTRAAIVYQQIDIGSMANDIYGFTIDYDKFIRIRCIMRGRKLSLMQVIFSPRALLKLPLFCQEIHDFFYRLFHRDLDSFRSPSSQTIFHYVGLL